MESYHDDVYKTIMEETSLILILVMAEGCMENDTALEIIFRMIWVRAFLSEIITKLSS